jgi:hypothetical protein
MKRPQPRSRLAAFAGILLLAAVTTAAVQARKFPGGSSFNATDGENNISLWFDSTGTLIAYVNGEAFSRGTWEARADTLLFSALEAPEGYGCPAGARYLWSIADDKLTVKNVNDECPIRVQYFTGFTWTKG